MMNLQSPIPITEIESVLAWVDTYKLSRPTKKINRDFSDAVLLAEILFVHYPKLVEMHNYPPRNSHSLKLNNWMTLNRKVLKKLKLNLCYASLEQLANASPGLIERVLISVRDKIHRDEEASKPKGDENEMSSGGSYHEAICDDDNVLVIPVKNRVNGSLEIRNQKVINYNSYLLLKEESKDAKESNEVLKQKVEHLDNLLKLKDERIEELQKQLERKVSRRKEIDAQNQNSWTNIDASSSYSAPATAKNSQIFNPTEKKPSLEALESKIEEIKSPILCNNSKVSLHRIEVKPTSMTKISDATLILKPRTSDADVKLPKKSDSDIKLPKKTGSEIKMVKKSTSDMKVFMVESPQLTTLPEAESSYYEMENAKNELKRSDPDMKLVTNTSEVTNVKAEIDGVNSEIFVEAVVDEELSQEEFEDSEQDETNEPTTIEETIEKELKDITENTQKENRNCELN